jgi:hypothetical protein
LIIVSGHRCRNVTFMAPPSPISQASVDANL